MSAMTVFLSHSGAQKQWTRTLNETLGYVGQTTFFDERGIEPGDDVVDSIESAAATCDLAVVVLTEEYISLKKWPMKELLLFVRHNRRLLPLFMGLTVEDVKNPSNLLRWEAVWTRRGLDAHECKQALFRLCAISGIVYANRYNNDNEYMHKVVAEINRILHLQWIIDYANSSHH